LKALSLTLIHLLFGGVFMKKLISTLLLSAVLFASSTCFAATAQQQQACIEAAKTVVPASCNMLGYTEDKDKSKILFRDPETLRSYEVEVYTLSAKVHELEIRGSNSVASTQVVKTEADARQAILAKYPDASIHKVELDRTDRGLYKYDVEFSTPKFKGEADISPVTGAIGKEELEFF